MIEKCIHCSSREMNTWMHFLFMNTWMHFPIINKWMYFPFMNIWMHFPFMNNRSNSYYLQFLDFYLKKLSIRTHQGPITSPITGFFWLLSHVIYPAENGIIRVFYLSISQNFNFLLIERLGFIFCTKCPGLFQKSKP